MTLLSTDGSAFSDELLTLTIGSPQEWWKLIESQEVGIQSSLLLELAPNADRLVVVDSEFGGGEFTGDALGNRLAGRPEDGRLGDFSKPGHTLAIKDTDPLTGSPLSAALIAEAPAYPGYLLRYTPGLALESRPAVAEWQAQMQQRGWTIQVDGLYGPVSQRVAIAFQREKGLAADGIVGQQTWQAAFDESTITVDPVSVSATSGSINDVGLRLIKDFEGLRLNAYQDAVGVWTIGYGHTNTAYPGQRITTAQATALLRQDVANFENAVNRAVRVPLNENQFAALVSFAYNVGSGALNSSTLLRRLNAGDTFGAANEFLRWNRAGGRVLAGLTRRREAERSLFLS